MMMMFIGLHQTEQESSRINGDVTQKNARHLIRRNDKRKAFF